MICGVRVDPLFCHLTPLIEPCPFALRVADDPERPFRLGERRPERGPGLDLHSGRLIDDPGAHPFAEEVVRAVGGFPDDIGVGLQDPNIHFDGVEPNHRRGEQRLETTEPDLDLPEDRSDPPIN